MSLSTTSTFTDQEYWEYYWEERLGSIPDNIVIPTDKYSRGIYLPFKKFIDPKKKLSVLEIGGAPGLIISSLTKFNSHLKLGILDYSETGIKEAEQVFLKYKLDVEVHQVNFYEDDLSVLPKYDLVYSLGVVEHYTDLENSLNKHLECVENGGIVIIGVPVFLGINKWLLEKFAPENRSTMYSSIMDNKLWSQFYERKDIKILFDEYVGGFSPNVHHRLENKKYLWRRVLYVLFHQYFAKLWNRIPNTDKVNSKYFSFYYYFVVQKTEVELTGKS